MLSLSNFENWSFRGRAFIISVQFVLTDYKGSNFSVAYTGILPDLFREGQGIVVRGNLDDRGIFKAEEVLAKHDENYMPKELTDLDSISR